MLLTIIISQWGIRMEYVLLSLRPTITLSLKWWFHGQFVCPTPPPIYPINFTPFLFLSSHSHISCGFVKLSAKRSKGGDKFQFLWNVSILLELLQNLLNIYCNNVMKYCGRTKHHCPPASPPCDRLGLFILNGLKVVCSLLFYYKQ